MVKSALAINADNVFGAPNFKARSLESICPEDYYDESELADQLDAFIRGEIEEKVSEKGMEILTETQDSTMKKINKFNGMATPKQINRLVALYFEQTGERASIMGLWRFIEIHINDSDTKIKELFSDVFQVSKIIRESE